MDLLLVAILIGSGCGAGKASKVDTITVSAAASLTDALIEIGRDYERQHPGSKVRLNFGASGKLQRQVEEGAPVDLFVSASPKETTALVRMGRVQPNSVVELLGNALVLVAPQNSSLKRWEDLLSTKVRRIAMGNPDTVPSGRYGQQTLQKRSLWPKVEKKLVFAENVRQALAYAASGDADAAIVFASDASSEARVEVLAVAQSTDHERIVYPAALVGQPRPEAREFLNYLQGTSAQETFRRHGFLPLAGSRLAP
jgi:molybdate transport system substrate-binding protein